jgi:hypothetical protein
MILIEPAQSDTMYVPYYEPAVVYGEWPYADYPPYYFGAPPYIGAGVIAAGLAFGTAWAIGRWGNYWGGGFNWGNRNLYVNHYNRVTNVGNNWQHNPAHRQGVRYSNANVQQRFGNSNLKAGASNRMISRGLSSGPVWQDRPAAGDRAGPGRRAGDRAGDRGGDRAGWPVTLAAGPIVGRSSGNKPKEEIAPRRDRAASAGKPRRRDRAEERNVGRHSYRGAAAARETARVRGAAAASAGRRRGPVAVAASRRRRRRRRLLPRWRRPSLRLELKQDVTLLGYLENGLGYYRQLSRQSVGVIAQGYIGLPAPTRRDGYLRVHYENLD